MKPNAAFWGVTSVGSGKKSKTNLGVATKTAGNPAIQIGTANVAVAVKPSKEDISFGPDFSMTKVVGAVQNAAGKLAKDITSKHAILTLEPSEPTGKWIIFKRELDGMVNSQTFPLSETMAVALAKEILGVKKVYEEDGITVDINVSDALPEDIRKAIEKVLNPKPYVARIKAVLKDGKIVVVTEEV